ncbi:PK beta-barrel-protein domain-containing protein-like protein [Xylariomycetidae sp. FL2044]|nr:PK beta-barrel-protein domain-containing protein-like protein [Xylariomycetidae sp. FL2044]
MSRETRTEVDLRAPFERDIILEVRTSQMKTMPGLTIETGIDKQTRAGRIPVSKVGLDADEHDLTFHGGPDKAIHGYCSSHYAGWRAEHPSAAPLFVPGGFGENFVTAHMNERNVCIGDIVSVGPPPSSSSSSSSPPNPSSLSSHPNTTTTTTTTTTPPEPLLLQVSLPRQPCFKLNHRFHLKNFAPLTHRSSRTGWYYRVLRPGTAAAGDEIRLVERPWPRWTIERVQEYLHRTPGDEGANAELARIPELGRESRGVFEDRVRRAEARKAREEEGGVQDGKAEKEEEWRDYKIVQKKRETDRVISIILEPVEPTSEKQDGAAANPTPDDDTDTKEEEEEEEDEIGAHVRLKLPNGLIRSYSIVSGGAGPGRRRLELGVALATPSRGGSAWLHETARVGDVVRAGRTTEDVRPAMAASAHVFLVGGIGITAFLSLMEVYRRVHLETRLHYAVRSAERDVPFRARVEALDGGTEYSGGSGKVVTMYDGSRGERMDIGGILEGLGWNSHVYVCGPPGMTEEARREARRCGLGEDEVHFEAFGAEKGEEEKEKSEKKKKKKNRVFRVGEEETLLEVLRRELGDEEEVPSSCEVGNCGTCKVNVLRGTVEHRGTALMEEEKGRAMLSCVSRGVGRIAIEI